MCALAVIVHREKINLPQGGVRLVLGIPMAAVW
jgi:hypothetical protein